MNTRRSFFTTAVLPAALPALALAQTTPRKRGQMTRVLVSNVKPDQVDEWLALQKNEINPILLKAGIKRRTLYRTVLGNTSEFLSLSPLESYAEMDDQGSLAKAAGSAAAWNNLLSKTRRHVLVSRSYVAIRLDDLSTPASQESPELMVQTLRRVNPGRMSDYEQFVKAEVLPHYLKAKVAMSTSQRSLGASSSEVVTGTPLKNMAELDAGPLLRRTMDPAAYAKLTAKGASLATTLETFVRRRVAELSFSA